jgi:hypothetical protein
MQEAGIQDITVLEAGISGITLYEHRRLDLRRRYSTSKAGI